MFVELVHATTTDTLTLQGVLRQPRRDVGGPGERHAIDAVLTLHGVGGNFYNSVLLATIADRLLEAGITVLAANTRGHDFVSIIRTSFGPRRYGAAYESVDECRHDIAAWLELLTARGNRRIAVLGHSLGAIKALYTAVRHATFPIERLIAISPPCLSFTRFRSGPRAKLFARYIARAQAHVEEGTPLTLMRVRYPFPLLITAAGYLDKYGRQERYNILRFAHRVPCPTLFMYGQRELDSGSVAFQHLPEDLRELHLGVPHARHHLIVPDADHVYSGQETRVAHAVVQWLGDALRGDR